MVKKIAVAIISLGLLTGCTGTQETATPTSEATSTSIDQSPLEPISINGVQVTGTLGSAPVVEISELNVSVNELQIADQKVGTGQSVPAGATVLAHYAGYGLTTGAKFDSSWDRGAPIQFGLDQVIAGWSEGVPGMKIGGRRVLVIPAELAYGQNPPPGSGIEPGETLLFVIDLVDFL